MGIDAIPAYAGIQCGVAGEAYNEAAFHQFLRVERARAKRSTRSLLVLLVSVKTGSGPVAVPASLQPGIFAGIGASVRESDFVGWYREGRVAGAVLTLDGPPPRDARTRMLGRLEVELKRQVAAVVDQLRLRAVLLSH